MSGNKAGQQNSQTQTPAQQQQQVGQSQPPTLQQQQQQQQQQLNQMPMMTPQGMVPHGAGTTGMYPGMMHHQGLSKPPTAVPTPQQQQQMFAQQQMFSQAQLTGMPPPPPHIPGMPPLRMGGTAAGGPTPMMHPRQMMMHPSDPHVASLAQQPGNPAMLAQPPTQPQPQLTTEEHALLTNLANLNQVERDRLQSAIRLTPEQLDRVGERQPSIKKLVLFIRQLAAKGVPLPL